MSVIIPMRNGSVTIGRCLESIFGSDCGRFEVIVVDDCSEDESVEIVSGFPCRLIRLDRHSGASTARNAGARAAKGDILFFTDADCLLERDTLSRAEKAIRAGGPGTVIGGTYTSEPGDTGFYSRFQSVFIHYSETRKAADPDYVASHAMAIEREAFVRTGGFCEQFLPMIEDVEYSHRLRDGGHRLLVDPGVLVRHIFNFSFLRSLRNAFRKSFYWTLYSLGNRDLFSDSGTASHGLKLNVASFFPCLVCAGAAVLASTPAFLAPVPLLAGVSLTANFRLFRAFSRAGGAGFAFFACGYYSLVYPIPVAAGGLTGLFRYLRTRFGLGAKDRFGAKRPLAEATLSFPRV